MRFPRFRQPPEAETFRFPLPWHGRLALLDTDLHGPPGSVNLASADLAAIEVFAPESIALPLPLALTYAAQRIAEASLLPSICGAIVVLSSLHTPGGPMTAIIAIYCGTSSGCPFSSRFLDWTAALLPRNAKHIRAFTRSMSA